MFFPVQQVWSQPIPLSLVSQCIVCVCTLALTMAQEKQNPKNKHKLTCKLYLVKITLQIPNLKKNFFIVLQHQEYKIDNCLATAISKLIVSN